MNFEDEGVLRATFSAANVIEHYKNQLIQLIDAVDTLEL